MSSVPVPNPPIIDHHILTLIQLAVEEDLGGPGITSQKNDRTVALANPPGTEGVARIVARGSGIVAGGFLLPTIMQQYHPRAAVRMVAPDGATVAPGQIVAEIAGPLGSLLSAERVLLNFLSHLSGVATFTRRFVEAVAGVQPPPAICDTRKTTPGFRMLEKYAVVCGGGVNHRMGLYDGVMLKDNHLAALRHRLGQAPTLAQLTAQIRRELAPEIPLWLEVDTLEQLEEALPEGRADVLLLDNFTVGQLHQAADLRNAHNPGRRPFLEASGGITLQNVAAVARTGVERISIGALTHSAPALDFSEELL